MGFIKRLVENWLGFASEEEYAEWREDLDSQLVHLGNKVREFDVVINRYRSDVDKIAGFSRDLQIIRDQIKREWQSDPTAMRVLASLMEMVDDASAYGGYLRRIAAALERISPIPIPTPTLTPRPSDLSDLRTVTDESADEKTKFWRDLAIRHNIAPDSDMFQALILDYEESVYAKAAKQNEQLESPIDWDKTFGEAAKEYKEYDPNAKSRAATRPDKS